MKKKYRIKKVESFYKFDGTFKEEWYYPQYSYEILPFIWFYFQSGYPVYYKYGFEKEIEAKDYISRIWLREEKEKSEKILNKTFEKVTYKEI